jgi:hypothetical protein
VLWLAWHTVLGQPLAGVKTSSGWGFIHMDGTWLSDSTYAELIGFSGGYGWARATAESNWQIIDATGKLAEVPQVSEVHPFKEGLALTKTNGKYGFIQPDGTWGIPATYEYLEPFEEGLAVCRRNGKYGYVNRKGEVQIPCMYDYADGFSEGTAAVRKGGFWEYINPQNESVLKLPSVFTEARSFAGGLSQIEQDGKYGYLSRAGKVVVAPKYEDADIPVEGLAKVNLGGYVSDNEDEGFGGGLYGFIDTGGKVVVPIVYEKAYAYTQGLAAVRKSGKWGFLNKQGLHAVDMRFDEALSFGQGLAPVKLNGRWGYINPKGDWVLKPRFLEAEVFGH